MAVGLFLRERSKLTLGGRLCKAETFTDCVRWKFGFHVSAVEVSGLILLYV